jgi:ABC-type lipopolysaccharide export system ATPase subunit
MSNLTAVEWLIGNLNEKNLVSTTDENFREYIKIVTQAYEMFYEQVTEAYDAGLFDGTMENVKDRIYKKYFNETYGGGK